MPLYEQETEDIDYGAIIKRVRKRLGMTQEELAKRSGMSISTIGKYERGLLHPKESSRKKLYDALGIEEIRKFSAKKVPTWVDYYDNIRELMQKLNLEGMKRLNDVMMDLTEIERYTKK